ncbi:MAG: type II secretion system minor pseudopilin GspK, partial [Gemmatimonadota bacterium]
ARATIAGGIEDVQSRMNLRNLVGLDGKVSIVELEALRRLCNLLSLPSATADLIAVAMLQSRVPPAAPNTNASPDDGSNVERPLPLMLPQDLYGVAGLDPQAAAVLIPYVTVLPEAPTPVNVNTASAEVIAARVGMSLSAARALVAERDRIGYFTNVDNFRTRLPNQGVDLDTQQISTQSRYFLVRGQVRLDRATTRMEALVRRPAVNQVVQVLWEREL